MNIPVSQRARRLPVYLLVDKSSSMSGEPIVAVNQGLQMLKSDLEHEPRAIQTVWLSVISFGGQASIEVPLTELMAFVPPSLRAEGGTPMGEALRLLNQALDNDVSLATGPQTGDYKPLIFLFTDGEPTDDWRSAAQAVKQRSQAKTANIIAVGCGPNVNVNTLKEITESVMLMNDTNAGSFQRLLAWVSQSTKIASVKRASTPPNSPDPPVELPPVPAGFVIV